MRAQATRRRPDPRTSQLVICRTPTGDGVGGRSPRALQDPTAKARIRRSTRPWPRVPSALFGVCVVGTGGSVYAAGDTDYPFSIMSVSKPFVFAMVCQ